MWTRGEWTRLQKLADDLPETSVPCCADLRTSVFFVDENPAEGCKPHSSPLKMVERLLSFCVLACFRGEMLVLGRVSYDKWRRFISSGSLDVHQQCINIGLRWVCQQAVWRTPPTKMNSRSHVHTEIFLRPLISRHMLSVAEASPLLWMIFPTKLIILG